MPVISKETSYISKVYFKATDPFSERWQSAWIITAFWDVMALGLLCVMCYLWAPSQSSQRSKSSLSFVREHRMLEPKIYALTFNADMRTPLKLEKIEMMKKLSP